MYKILIVEDDSVISAGIKKYLESWEYECKAASDFHDIIGEFVGFSPDLVLMDIGLPSFDGYYWCREIRKISQVPVIFLSSMSDNMNIVMAINMGGDDFIGKPFDVQVLTAKVEAMLRRTYELHGTDMLLKSGGVVLDQNKASVHYGENAVELTKNEYRILQKLMEHAGRIVSREDIMEALWSTDSYVDDNALTVSIARLRKKLEGMGLKDYIITKRGIGYQVDTNEKE
ncbi:response regulator transcription factor [Hespellia stercorisuis]|uniref:Stage 0 sporulation protein A homolog n=1 Tax=Hespellia stercorisuis DSM 15480 TaxID=1121950 RepID=A0A1M6UH16_9FIRM|nr:response regulator transcription factor [Hespellia stercorisuis]SHK68443.1 DNA-binding response regulator, OmpR family, contains REC and winged-helix (wHTH) domain [Hespellia stercorisuis DSM 15480]